MSKHYQSWKDSRSQIFDYRVIVRNFRHFIANQQYRDRVLLPKPGSPVSRRMKRPEQDNLLDLLERSPQETIETRNP